MNNVVLANCTLMHPQSINVAAQILGKRASTERLIATLSCNTRGALTLSHSLKHIDSKIPDTPRKAEADYVILLSICTPHEFPFAVGFVLDLAGQHTGVVVVVVCGCSCCRQLSASSRESKLDRYS